MRYIFYVLLSSQLIHFPEMFLSQDVHLRVMDPVLDDMDFLSDKYSHIEIACRGVSGIATGFPSLRCLVSWTNHLPPGSPVWLLLILGGL